MICEELLADIALAKVCKEGICKRQHIETKVCLELPDSFEICELCKVKVFDALVEDLVGVNETGHLRQVLLEEFET